MKGLSSLVFIVEKRNVIVKARKCAVGSKKSTFPGYVKSDWASLTVMTNRVIIASTIEAEV